MRCRWLSLAMGACVLSGCFNFGGYSDHDRYNPYSPDAGAERPMPPPECLPEPSQWELADALYDTTETSVHEIITCGGMQVTLAGSLLIIVLTSNRDFFDEATLDEIRGYSEALGFTLDVPFENRGDGTWAMPIADTTGSEFSVRFRDPATGDVVVEDPFTIDSYLTGVTATAELPFQRMRDDPSLRNTFTYSWDQPGPLARLMNDGSQIPNPFTVTVSLYDMLALAGTGGFWGGEATFGGDLGPIDSVLDLEMEATVRYRDDRESTRIEYDVEVVPGSVRDIAASGSLDFDVRAIHAWANEFEIEGNASALSFVERGLLAGPIDYVVSGPSVDLRVTSDFETGRSYPVSWWECP